MNIEKSQLKMLVAGNLGASIEDRLESTGKTVNELMGGYAALHRASSKVPNDIIALVEKDEEIKDGLDAHIVRQKIKKYITRVGDYLEHLGEVSKQSAITQAGVVDGLRQAMDIIKKEHDAEAAKIEIATSIDEDSVIGETPRTMAEAAKNANGSSRERRAKESAPKKATRKKATRKKATAKKESPKLKS